MAGGARLSGHWPAGDSLPATRTIAVTMAAAVVGVGVSRGLAESNVVAAWAAAILIGLAIVSPAGALGAAILAIPTSFTLHPVSRGSFSLLEISILSLSAGLAIRLLGGGRKSIGEALRALFQPIAITLPALALLPVAAVAFVMLPENGVPDVALREMRVVLFEPLLLFAAALVVMKDCRARSWAWTCAATIGVIVGIGAVIQVVGGFGGVEVGSMTRATGIYSHPNNLALFLERTFLLTLPVLAFRPTTSLLWVAVVAQLTGLGLTLSRGGLLAAFVGIGILLVILGSRRNRIVGAGLGLVVGSVLVIAARDRVYDLGGSGSEPTRFAIWRSSVRMLMDHPVFGVGPDQFLYQYGQRYIEPPAWDERYTSHPHNIVLDVWLRLGAAGVGAFAALVLAVWKAVARGWNVIRSDAMACGAIAALAGGFAHGLLDNGFFLPDLACLTWISIALIATTRMEPASDVDGEVT